MAVWSSRGRFLGVVVVAALAATACSSDDAEQGAEGTAAVGSMSPSDATPTAGPSDGYLERATTFWEALGTGDRDTAVRLIDPDLVLSGSGSPFGRAHTLEGQFEWYEAVGWQWNLEKCESNEAGRVSCTATARNAWSDALGVEPVTGAFAVRFGGDRIVGVDEQRGSFSSQWLPQVFDEFAGWVRTNYPSDAREMFDFSRDVNPEILALYATNTERFVEVHTAG